MERRDGPSVHIRDMGTDQLPQSMSRRLVYRSPLMKMQRKQHVGGNVRTERPVSGAVVMGNAIVHKPLPEVNAVFESAVVQERQRVLVLPPVPDRKAIMPFTQDPASIRVSTKDALPPLQRATQHASSEAIDIVRMIDKRKREHQRSIDKMLEAPIADLGRPVPEPSRVLPPLFPSPTAGLRTEKRRQQEEAKKAKRREEQRVRELSRELYKFDLLERDLRLVDQLCQPADPGQGATFVAKSTTAVVEEWEAAANAADFNERQFRLRRMHRMAERREQQRIKEELDNVAKLKATIEEYEEKKEAEEEQADEEHPDETAEERRARRKGMSKREREREKQREKNEKIRQQATKNGNATWRIPVTVRVEVFAKCRVSATPIAVLYGELVVEELENVIVKGTRWIRVSEGWIPTVLPGLHGYSKVQLLTDKFDDRSVRLHLLEHLDEITTASEAVLEDSHLGNAELFLTPQEAIRLQEKREESQRIVESLPDSHHRLMGQIWQQMNKVPRPGIDGRKRVLEEELEIEAYEPVLQESKQELTEMRRHMEGETRPL